MHLREFNEQGVEQFREALAELRQDPAGPVPWELLEEPSLTERFEPQPAPHIELDRPGFNTRREVAEYLHQKLDDVPDRRVLQNTGLWTWLSLYYFDDVCPAREGKRRVLNDYSYVYEPPATRNDYRHLLAISFKILRMAPSFNKLMLDRPLHRFDDATKSVVQQLRILRIPCIFEVLERLYYDVASNRPKHGITTSQPEPGDLRHRLPARINQLQKTYDLHTLNADQLIELLGPEFQPWLEGTPAPSSS